jgi:hypothetical protein
MQVLGRACVLSAHRRPWRAAYAITGASYLASTKRATLCEQQYRGPDDLLQHSATLAVPTPKQAAKLETTLMQWLAAAIRSGIHALGDALRIIQVAFPHVYACQLSRHVLHSWLQPSLRAALPCRYAWLHPTAGTFLNVRGTPRSSTLCRWVPQMCCQRALAPHMPSGEQVAGPTFVKLGQWAGTRPDIFPLGLCRSLEYVCSTHATHRLQPVF